MNVVVLFSGGKDSTYSIWWAINQGFEVVSLLSAIPSEESMMFHHPNALLTEKLAECISIPWKGFSSGVGEREELRNLEKALSEFRGKAEAVVSGAIASDYQKNRIDRISEKLGLISYSPLWHKNQESLVREIISAGFDVRVAGVFAEGLGEKWLGRKIDSDAIDELVSLEKKFGVSVAGEGGEWESIVVNCPIFEKRLEILSAENVWEGNSGKYIVKSWKISGKS